MNGMYEKETEAAVAAYCVYLGISQDELGQAVKPAISFMLERILPRFAEDTRKHYLQSLLEREWHSKDACIHSEPSEREGVSYKKGFLDGVGWGMQKVEDEWCKLGGKSTEEFYDWWSQVH